MFNYLELHSRTQTTSNNIQNNDEFTPLSYWYSEMIFKFHTPEKENKKGEKFFLVILASTLVSIHNMLFVKLVISQTCVVYS